MTMRDEAPPAWLAEMASRLRQTLPPEAGDAIVHNDFRLGNVIWSQDAPPRLLARMAGYAVLDLFVGLVPVAGDAVDFVLRANTRNCALLERHLDDLEGVQREPSWRRWLELALLAGGLVLALWLAWRAGVALMALLSG